MKFASWEDAGGRATFGVVEDDRAFDLSGFRGSTRLVDLMSDVPGRRDIVDRLSAARSVPLKTVRFLPPIPEPKKIFCVGTNYRQHIAELGRAYPKYPIIFTRFADTFVGHGDGIVSPSVSPTLDWEGELAVVISRYCERVDVGQAMDFVAGYTCCSENSVREYQMHNAQVTPGKNFRKSGGLGPWMVSADDVDPGDLTIRTRISGELEQESSTKDMLFGIAEIIAYISTFSSMGPGDVIATGTPSGVGAFRTPPKYLAPGDVVEVQIEGIGTLTNPVVGDGLPRT